MQSKYFIKETKTSYKFSYTGDLREALEKAERDLQKEICNKDVAHWEFILKKAKSTVESHYKKIARLEAFIKRAKIQLDRESVQHATNQT